MRKARKRTGPYEIPSTEAAKNFGTLVDRVRERAATYTIVRGGRPVAEISPIRSARHSCTIAGLAAFFRREGRADERFLAAVEREVAERNEPRVPDDPWAR